MKWMIPVLAVCALAVVPAHASLDIDFGASIRLGNDDDVFLSISARYFDRDRPALERVARHYPNSDDFAVVLFLSNRSGANPDRIHRLRRQGLSWWEVSARLGLSPDIWFVRVERDPGPPYGKAYGHWKKRHQDHRYSFTLADTEIRDLVAVRVIHEYFGVSTRVAMNMRASGDDLRHLTASEYKNRHGHRDGHDRDDRHDRDDDDRDHRGKSKGKGKGKGWR